MDHFLASRQRFWLLLGSAILIIGLPVNPWTVPDWLLAPQFCQSSKRLWLAIFNALAFVVGTTILCQRRKLARTLFVGRSGTLIAGLSAISGMMAAASLELGSLLTPLPPAALDAGTRYMYRDHYLYSPAPMTTAKTTFTDYYSARQVPANAALESADQVVWFFGGSTIQDVVVADDETIVHHAVQTLAARGISAHAKNFGTVRFSSSMELVKLTELLRRIPKGEHPDIAVFYDGYNDSTHGVAAGAGNVDPVFAAQLRMLIEGEADKMLLYSATRIAANYSAFFARIAMPRIQVRLFNSGFAKHPTLANSRAAADIYIANTEMIRTICETQFGIRCLFVLQPMSFTRVQPAWKEKSLERVSDAYRRAYDEYYATVRTGMAGQPDFVDASGIFDDVDGEVYVDLGHTNAKGSRRAGAFIGEELVRLIERSDPRSTSSSSAPHAGRTTERATR